MDWSTLPDLCAVALLTCAFGSVARRGLMPGARLWLIGWLAIVLHFAAFLFDKAPGAWGTLAVAIGLNALAWGGILFMWACVPYRNRPSSRWMLTALLAADTLYISLVSAATVPFWTLTAAAILIGAAPLAVGAFSLRRGFTHPLRWALVILNVALAAFLLAIQRRTPNGIDFAFDAVIFSIYFGCCFHFWYAFRRASAGAFITIAGFAAWALVFVVAPFMQAWFPAMHVQSEVWNLPKYVVAVGMILLLLEQQVEHNRYLALHDELTGLPNRRLFQDRLSSALERARRNGTCAALLLIDLDHFKIVNDSVGHHIGDLLLQRVGSLFLARMRRSDTVARTGGDEFCIILEDPTSRADASRVGDALIQLLREPLEVENHRFAVGASVGIAVYPDDAATAETLRIAADRSMYADKSVSRRGVAEPMGG
jgi:diguanylate cyclase (GGDEF)-like protein